MHEAAWWGDFHALNLILYSFHIATGTAAWIHDIGRVYMYIGADHYIYMLLYEA